MNLRRVLQIDCGIQLLGVAILVSLAVLIWIDTAWLDWGLLALLLLVVWQFLSGIYIAAEFKMWHRGVPPGSLLVLVTLGILFAAAGFRSGVLLCVLLFPLILLSNVVLAGMDWYRGQDRSGSNRFAEERSRILDTEDVFH